MVEKLRQATNEYAPLVLVLRGGIVNRTYSTHKNLYIFLFLPTIFGPIYNGPRLRSCEYFDDSVHKCDDISR